MASRTTLELATITRQDLVLESYANVGTLKASCEAIDRTYEMADRWVRLDIHHFKRRLAVAREQYTASLEVLMHNRLTDPTGNRGSDVLLMFNLKAKRPDVYRETPVVINMDASRDLQDKLAKMASEAMAKRVTVTPVETVASQVVRALGPGEAKDQ